MDPQQMEPAGNPLAQHLQSQGRGEDTMLVHMTPEEVNSLQGLALHHGTTMTINPNTGLPEAGLLGTIFKKLIPTLLGGALAATGIGAPLAAGIVGLGSTVLTGSLKKGLMAGLGAFGGASLAGAAGLGGKIAGGNAFGLLSDKAGIFGANMGAGVGAGGAGLGALGNTTLQTAPSSIVRAAAPDVMTASAFNPATAFSGAGTGLSTTTAMLPSTTAALTSGVTGAIPAGVTSAANTAGAASAAAKKGIAGFAQKFGQTASRGLPGIIGKAAPGLAVTGLMQGVGGAMDAAKKKSKDTPVEQDTWKDEGPYMPVRRTFDPRLTGPGGRGEIDYFSEPQFGGYLTASGELRGLPPGYTPPPRGYAEGGETNNDIKEYATKLISEGYTDPNTGNFGTLAGDPLSIPGVRPGAVSDLGGLQFQVNDQGKWEYKGPIPGSEPAPAPTALKDPEVETLTLSNVDKVTTPPPGTGSNTTTNTNTASNVTSSVLGLTQNTPTTKVEGLPPGAKTDSYGVYTKPETYTPTYTKLEDFVTDKVNPYTGGTEQTNKLEEYINSYRTSPGPLKSTSMGYAPGQSPSERNRAYALELAKEAADRRAAEEAARRTATGTGTTGTAGTGYNGTDVPADYGWTPPGVDQNTTYTGGVPGFDFQNFMNTYEFDPVTGQYVPKSGGGGRADERVQNHNARGGSVNMGNGSFVVDARTVSELGNGSSNAGIEMLQRLGGQAVRGPGDGVSDSVPAKIGGVQNARVARDEVIFPAQAVKRLGGAKKLYALMDKAHKARKKAGRGTDTKLRNGLGVGV